MKETKRYKDKDSVEVLLDAYFEGRTDSHRWTSQDIVDNLREMGLLTRAQVTDYMLRHDYELMREDDRLVWVINKE